MAIRVPRDTAVDDVADAGAPSEIDLRSDAPVDIEDLYAHRAALHRLCERIVGDSATADDMVQETYLRALRNLDRLEQRPSLMPWLATVARRRSLDEIRRRRHATPVEFFADQPTFDEVDPEKQAADVDTVEHVRSALSVLNEREHHLLQLQVDRGLSLSELAEEEGTSVGSVRSVLARARAKLRATLGDHDVPALAPIGAAVAWLRRRAGELNTRLHEARVPPGAMERLAEAVAATVVTVAVGGGALTSPSGLGPSANPRNDLAATSEAVPSADAGATGADPAARSAASAGAPAAPASAPDGTPTDAVTAATPSDLLLPDDDVETPEEAAFSRVVASSDGALVAAGARRGECATACTVLFVSPDGGATWERRDAAGITGTNVAVAPHFPADPRIFATGPAGVSVSRDGGATFAPIGVTLASGPIAVTPGFSDGDERLFVGSQPAWVYNDETRTARPMVAGPAGSPSATFAFAPAYSSTGPSTGELFAGAAGSDGTTFSSWVHRCRRDVTGDTCVERVALPGGRGVPDVAVSRSFTSDRTVFAWTVDRLFVSHDRARTFAAVELPGDLAVLDVSDDAWGTFFAAVHSPSGETPGGVLRSRDGGRHWEWVGKGTRLDAGASSVAVSGSNHVVAAPLDTAGGGVLCSSNAGETWTDRCPGRSA